MRAARAERTLDTTRIRLCRDAGLCVAPQYLAEELLRAEGFTDVEYVPETSEVGTSKLVASGAADINLSFALSTLVRVDAGEPIVLLAGVHVGCYELFGTPAVRTVRELKGRRAGRGLDPSAAADHAAEVLIPGAVLSGFWRAYGLCCVSSELGESAEALQVYRRCRDMLSIALALSPSPETEAIRATLR